jgi:formate/nitrite transporter
LAVCLAVTASAQTGVKLSGALIFPTGFVILILLGLDLVTGNFALAFLPKLNGEPIPLSAVFRNWNYVFWGNLLGSLVVALLVAISMTIGFTGPPTPEGDMIKQIAMNKTQGYATHGFGGLVAVTIRAILCNWMVTLGVVLGMTSKNTAGKVIAMWLPIMLFFGLGYEHAVVNMFVIPLGMLLGAEVTLTDWWLWNQIPVTIGNALGGITLTGLALFAIHNTARASQTHSAPSLQVAATKSPSVPLGS